MDTNNFQEKKGISPILRSDARIHYLSLSPGHLALALSYIKWDILLGILADAAKLVSHE